MAGAGILVLSACAGSAGSDPLAPDGVAFDGLPPDVVAERLSDPVLQENLELQDEDVRPGMAQLNVSSTIFCRDAFEGYQGWLRTGNVPSTPGVARPSAPAEGFDDFMDVWSQSVSDSIDSGDPEVLRSWLILDGGCRSTVVDPGDGDRKTVSDALEGT